MRLISGSLYNSYYNLKRYGEIYIFIDKEKYTINIIPYGDYTLKSIGEVIKKILEKRRANEKLDAEKDYMLNLMT